LDGIDLAGVRKPVITNLTRDRIKPLLAYDGP
jgi:hypothetical protein